MSSVIFTEKQHEAFKSIKNGDSVFLTGPAGSGKSFLLNYFIKNYEGEKSEIYVTSTTGLSAILIDGITIHRYAGIGTGDKDIDTYYKKISKMKNLRDRWRNTKILIIDEISMMDSELFDKLEILAKKIRKNDKPFGGIQIILSGDFLQLPPVKSNDFAFDAISWDFVIDKVFYFNEIIRQDDNSLKYVLNNIRVGVVDENVRRLLDSYLNKKSRN
jgi:ATP-dependent DNA helicase PIF1